MLNFTPNQVLDKREAEQAKADIKAQERQNRPVVSSLAAYVRDCWEASLSAKRKIEKRMINSLRRKNGVYSPTKLAEIQAQGGSTIFMMLTDEKCSAVTSWLADILFPAGDKPWGIKPTPVPDLTQEQQAQVTGQVQAEFQQIVMEAIQAEFHQEVVAAMQSGQLQTDEQAQAFLATKAQELFSPDELQKQMQARAEEMATEIRQDMEKVAKEARDRIETKLHDVVIEANWEDAVHDCLDDIATFPAGIVKGPVLRRKKKLVWSDANSPGGQVMDAGFQGTDPEKPQAQVVEEVSIDFNRVSPFDIYPLPTARTPEEGLIERHRLTRRYLTSLIGVKGYDDDAIRMVLQEYGTAGQSSWLAISNDQLRQELENRPEEWRSPETMIDALQFWGDVQGLKLLQYGLDPAQVPDPFMDYSVEVWLIDKYVIKAEINGDPLGRVPYNFASFRRRNGSIWGAGAAEVFEDCQDACNAAARALINNMGISSGPQVSVDTAALPPGTDITSMYPWKIWPVNSTPMMGASGRPPVEFFVPPSVANELMQIYQHFSSEADNKTGVPKYSYGSSDGTGGALGTATGFSMMMGNATRGIKNVIRNLDKGIIKPTIERTHQFQLLFFNDPEYRQGDVHIIARGSTAMIAKEQAAVRRNELLQIVTSSEPVLSVIGMTGLASMLREMFQSADFKDDDIVPDKRAMIAREQQEQVAMQEQAQIEGQQNQESLNQQTDPSGAVSGGRDVKTV